MDDRHFGFKRKFLRKNTGREVGIKYVFRINKQIKNGYFIMYVV